MPNRGMVKKLVALAFLAASMAFADDSSSSQAKALKLYPSLGQADSPLNKRFVARVKALRAADDPVMHRADWPLVIATQLADEIGIAPLAQTDAMPAPMTNTQTNPLPLPTPKWVPRGTALDNPGRSSTLGTASQASNQATEAASEMPTASVEDVARTPFSLEGKMIAMTWGTKPDIQEVAVGEFEINFSHVIAKATREQASMLDRNVGTVYVVVTKADKYHTEVKLLGNAIKSNGSLVHPELSFVWK